MGVCLEVASNRHKSCIEILYSFSYAFALSFSNRHKSCIEMYLELRVCFSLLFSNRHKSCIEILELLQERFGDTPRTDTRVVLKYQHIINFLLYSLLEPTQELY